MNFDKVYDRHHSDSAKYGYGVKEDQIPLTVADTDFPTSDFIVKAMRNRLEHPLFGYVKDNEDWKKALTNFYQRRFGLKMNPQNVIFASGVLASVTAFIRAFTLEGDGIILCSPIYDCFSSCITHCNRKVVDVPLLFENGSFYLDFANLEKEFKKKENKGFILCSPHNPVGKCFDKEELTKLFRLAKENDVLILSDEIHGLISSPGKKYLPSLCLEEGKDVLIMASSISKAFNTAGLQAAFAYADNPILKRRMKNQLGYDDCGEPNSFSLIALEEAYKNGDSYLDEFNEYVYQNRLLAVKELESLDFKVIKSDFTYLLWLDASSFNLEEETLNEKLKEAGLLLVPGSKYGKSGKGYFRMNIALPRNLLIEALGRIKKALK